MPRRNDRYTVALPAVIAALALSGPALGQQQVSNGNALDANTQVGSGGTNTRVGQVDYSARNNIVTGNVAGGRGFRDNVGYRAPGEFGDTLGSDDLFDFRASSLGSSPLIPNAAYRTQRYGGAGEAVSVYRSFTSLPNYVVSNARSGRVSIAPDGGSYGVFDPGRIATSASIADVLGARYQPIRFEGADVPESTAPGLTVSPLLGVRQIKPIRFDEPKADVMDVSPDAVGARRPESPGNLGEKSVVEPKRYGAPQEGEQPDDFRDTGMVSPGLLLGLQIQTDRKTGQDEAAQADRLERAIFGQEGLVTKAKPGMDVYNSLLNQIQGKEGDTFGKTPDKGDEPKQPGTQRGDFGQPDPLEQPAEKQITEAERLAADAIRRARELTTRPEPEQRQPQQGEEADEKTDDGQTPAQRQYTQQELDQQAELPESVRELVEQLRREVPRVSTLASQEAKDHANQLMAKAEQQLAQGEYFAAEGLYRQARRANPENPMTHVGLIHAQLAAGMVRSASYNLRQLFEQHPELINVRYEKRLLPPSKRMEWLQGELERMINSREYNTEPGLMLAYLGHQTDSRQVVRYGLAIAQAQAPRDPLLPLLRAIWLDDDQPAQPAPPAETNPAPANAPAKAPEGDQPTESMSK